MKLNYGGSDGRFSWILYKLENLKCWGKSDGVRYPSEYYQTKLETIENDIQQNTDQITETENDISALKSRTADLEGEVITNDYYFKYRASR